MKNTPVKLNFSRTNLFESLKILIYLIKFIRKNSIQIVHSHHRYFDFIIYVVTKFVKIKTITSVQSKVYGYKALSYKADKLIACSNCIKKHLITCLLYTSDAADERSSVDLGGRRIIKTKNNKKKNDQHNNK